MQTIGERLEEARKKRGVTLQDAADETKIRLEYLQQLEKGDIKDMALPEVYKRAFLKDYAKYLRMDPERLLADLGIPPARPGGGVQAVKAQKDLIGRLELGSETTPAVVTPASQETSTDAASRPALPIEPNVEAKSFTLPRWVFPLIGFILIIGIVGSAIGGIVSCAQQQKSPAKSATVATPTSFKVVALGDVTVIARQVDTNATLYAGSLKKGDEKTIDRTGSVKLQYSDGNLLEVEKDGKRYKMGNAGAGRRVID